MTYIDTEEKDIIESFEQALEKWEILPSDISSRQKMQSAWQQRWANTNARKPVTLRLQHRDILAFKIEAQKKGIPYQTLLWSVIHQYASGDLVMK